MPHSLSSYVRKSGGEGNLCTVCEIVRESAGDEGWLVDGQDMHLV